MGQNQIGPGQADMIQINYVAHPPLRLHNGNFRLILGGVCMHLHVILCRQVPDPHKQLLRTGDDEPRAKGVVNPAVGCAMPFLQEFHTLP
ncbi:hypothetical protein D3C81_1895080 [compost metagenome]